MVFQTKCVVCSETFNAIRKNGITCSKRCRMKRNSTLYHMGKDYHKERERIRRAKLKESGLSSYAILNKEDRKRQQRINGDYLRTTSPTKNVRPQDLKEIKKDIAYLRDRIKKYEALIDEHRRILQ